MQAGGALPVCNSWGGLLYPISHYLSVVVG